MSKTTFGRAGIVAGVFVALFAVGCGGKKTCEDVAKHVNDVAPSKTKTVEHLTSWCVEQKLAQSDLDCYMAATDSASVNACRAKSGK